MGRIWVLRTFQGEIMGLLISGFCGIFLLIAFLLSVGSNKRPAYCVHCSHTTRKSSFFGTCNRCRKCIYC